MTQFSDLPIDIILEILSHLSTSPPMLCALTQVNTSLRYFATPHLYDRMTKSSGWAHRQFFLALKNNPALCSHVHVYHTPTSRSARSISLWSEIRRGLCHLNNLKELVFKRQSRSCIPPKFRVLPQAKPETPLPFQLERFVWGVRSWKTNDALAFLRTQTEIRYLLWESETGGPAEYLGEELIAKIHERSKLFWEQEEPSLDSPGEVKLRLDTWNVYGSSNAGTGKNDDEAMIRQQIRLNQEFKEFRTMRGIRTDGKAKPFISFQYTRQRYLEDRPSFGGEEDWFVEHHPACMTVPFAE